MVSDPRWQRIDELYHAALERDASERAAFLQAACADDAALRREVESLLAEGAGEEFLTIPAVELAGRDLAASAGALIGQRIGPYEIVSFIGAGGMGEVYRARDTKLRRDVAIKVLPDAVAHNPDSVARFAREARLLAALNHPHIAAIHGLEETDGVSALVLELVEGDTLADRIARGPVACAEAVAIAKQIVEGLEAAHENGIVHRDLKPSNIKLRPDGTVKILDFGLAKALVPAQAGAGEASAMRMTGATRAGVVTGTPAYMSPEQAQGQPVDTRTDIWAFGCVFYEMLTGRPAFEGDTVSDTLAGILRDNPAWDALPPSTPRSIRRLVRRCLAKDRRERLQAIGDARLEIIEALTPRTEDEPAAAAAFDTPRAKRIAPMAAAAGVTALVVGLGTWMLKPSSPVTERLVARSLIAIDPFDQRPTANVGETRPPLARHFRTAVAVSPDGRTLVFRGMRDVGRRYWELFLRPLDRLEATPIPGTERAQNPFFSPDGAWIGFWANGEIRRIPTAGGPPSTIARVPGLETAAIAGASWGDGDVIVFTTMGTPVTGTLWRVAASGGSPEVVSKPSADERAHMLPHLVPGGQAVLFTLQKSLYGWDDAQIVVRSLVTGQQKVLLDDAADARYVPSGHLVFARRGTLMAVPFDPARLTLTGAAVALIDGVMQAVNNGNAGADSGAGQFAVAAQGRLLYVTGGITPPEERALVWVDRNGTVEPLATPRLEFMAARLAPDRRRAVAFTRPAASGGGRLWIHDIARGGLTPLTSQEERSMWGEWSPDGARIAFSTILPGRGRMSWRSADGAGKSEPLMTGDETFPPSPNSWSLDDKIAFGQGGDIWVLDVSVAGRRAEPIVQTPAGELHPAFSPDGKWLAYTSNESGRQEVYVRQYPAGPRVNVSTAGGASPAWRGDGAELFFVTEKLDGVVEMNAVPVTAAASGFSAGTPRKLFEGSYTMTGPARSYDVTPDGRRFLMVQRLDPPPPKPSEMVLVENWLEEVRRRVASKP